MVNDDTIVRATGGEVEFFQIVLDQHEVIYCEAAAAESFMPDENGIAVLSCENKSHMLNALPVLKAASTAMVQRLVVSWTPKPVKIPIFFLLGLECASIRGFAI